ncbi:MAG: DNA mismatch repair endonuclease MutL [Desulfobulbaceae bacterium]
MSKIRLLSDQLANRIAAGEVVERPASVVKELVENSLDAGADRIDVQIEGAGVRLVRVADNGEGMDGDDVLLSVERHATSKLTEDSSLAAIGTLGFRGEALPSIGSVSRLVLLSRPRDKDTGTRAEIRYGRLHNVHEAGCPPGTVVEVRDLFGNVPARRKFLKTARTELSHIEEALRGQALAHPGVAFTLAVEGRSVLDLPVREGLRERFYDLFRCRDHWLELDAVFSEGDISVRGFLLHPETSGSRGGRLRILVNGRPVQDRMIRHAVLEGLQGFVMKGQSPAGVVTLAVPPDQVDVNVHPAKQEIRFRRSTDIHGRVVRAVREALARFQDQVRDDLFSVPRESENPAPSRKEVEVGQAPEVEAVPPVTFSPEVGGESREKPPAFSLPTAEPGVEIEPVPGGGEKREKVPLPAEGGDLEGLRLVGVLFDLYLLCERGDSLVVIDQHAAHERILYEELRRGYLERDVPRQALMFPVSVELSTDLAETAERCGKELAALGFAVEHFGGDTWVIKGVPALVSHVDPSGLLRDTLEGLQGGSVAGAGTLAEGIVHILSTMACRGAVKAGDRLDPREVLGLLGAMRDTGSFSHCPHGRPVIRTFSGEEIRQWFKR